MIIPLSNVVYDVRSRDGTWCQLPYPNHKNGCPNFPKCINERRDFMELEGYDWFAVTEDFDLITHQEKMYANSVERNKQDPSKKTWTERQCRSVLYWQNGVRKKLRDKSKRFAVPLMGDIILDIPEANGVNVYATMAKHGVFLKANPDHVTKIMLVGKRTH